MKNILLFLSCLVLLISCKKEEPVPEQNNNSGYISQHFAHVKGTVTDSLTGDPIVGYNLQVVGPGTYRDTLTDGNYNLTVYWFYGKFSYPKPSNVQLMMVDSNVNVVKYLNFHGNLLVEDDTINVDFQVNL